MEWIVKGNLPTSYGKKGRARGTTSLEFISVLNAIKNIDFTEDEITSIISALKERRIITSAIRPEHKSDRDLIEYLEEFWDMEKSQYLKELEIRGKKIHFHYSQTNIGYIERHWKPLLNGKKVGEVTISTRFSTTRKL